MTVSYRSKDEDYMNRLQKAVLKGMKGQMPEEKQYTWNYVKKQLIMDDLHTFAVSKMGKLVHFPAENFNAEIMTVFLSPPTYVELSILQRMMEALGVSKDEVYTTYYSKAEAENEEEHNLMQTLMNSEIAVIQPRIVISFGLNFGFETHTIGDFKNAKILTTYDMRTLMTGTQEEVEQKKRKLWEDVKQIMQHYKLN